VFLAECEDFIGVDEPDGDNRGPAVEWLLKGANLNPGEPWCAAFVNRCAEIACAKKNVRSPLERVPLQGYVQSYYQYAAEDGWLTTDPAPGDLFLIWHRAKNRYAHMGVVAFAYSDGRFDTVEGNSNSVGSREGIEVAANTRIAGVGDQIKFVNPWRD
jgi:hypothetical protein